MTIVDGKKIAGDILARLRGEISKSSYNPHLAVVLVGDDKPSQTYVRNKQAAALQIGLKFSLYKFPQSISEAQLISKIKSIQAQKLDGIIIQLPLPAKFDKKKVLNQLNPDIDVDCLSWISLGKLVINDNKLIPPSPGAVLEILKYYKVDLKGKNVVLVGQGDLIGKPLTNIFMYLPVTLTVCNKETKNLGTITSKADILITGAGKYNLIRGSMIRKGAIVIDAGVNFKNGKMFGDINFAEVSKKAKIVTPTPGGVGPITVAKLLENTVAIAKKSQSEKRKGNNLK